MQIIVCANIVTVGWPYYKCNGTTKSFVCEQGFNVKRHLSHMWQLKDVVKVLLISNNLDKELA